MEIDAMGQAMDGSVEETIIPWKKAHSMMDIGGFIQMTTAWNGEIAWEDGMQGLRELDGAEGIAARQAADSINPFLPTLGIRDEYVALRRLRSAFTAILKLLRKLRNGIVFMNRLEELQNARFRP